MADYATLIRLPADRRGEVKQRGLERRWLFAAMIASAGSACGICQPATLPVIRVSQGRRIWSVRLIAMVSLRRWEVQR